jgi:choline O-acetyltransferase
MQSLSELPYPKKLEWTISAEVDQLRQRIAMETDSLISDLSLYILDFKEYGREFPKSQNMSPDSYIQLALQLTYYK